MKEKKMFVQKFKLTPHSFCEICIYKQYGRVPTPRARPRKRVFFAFFPSGFSGTCFSPPQHLDYANMHVSNEHTTQLVPHFTQILAAAAASAEASVFLA
jgi:hypothetical protein